MVLQHVIGTPSRFPSWIEVFLTERRMTRMRHISGEKMFSGLFTSHALHSKSRGRPERRTMEESQRT